MHPRTPAVVLAVRGTDQGRLRAALRRVAASPELLGCLARVVVVDAARTTTLLQEAVRLPVGMLRVVHQPSAAVPALLARLLGEAVGEQDASHVLVLDDVALTDPAALLAAIELARASVSAEVVGLRDAAAPAGPLGWWGAVLPIDAIHAVGATLPEAGTVALAELVLRADAVGFRPVEQVAAGPVPVVAEADRLLLALLHAPVGARRAVLLGAVRPGDPDALRALLAGPEPLPGPAPRVLAPRIRLWLGWPALRIRCRASAPDRSSAEAWTLRLGVDPMMQHGARAAGHGGADARRAGARSSASSAVRRGTSAA